MSNIPPAPPLPTVRPQSNTTRSAFARFVTQPFTRPSQHSRHEGLKPTSSLNHHVHGNNLQPSSSQHSSLTTRGAEIASLDKNKDGTHAVLAGRNILKTIRVDGTSCSEETDIRAVLINQDGANAAKPLDIYDVKWSHGEHGSYVATATSSGKIVVYDIAAHGIETWRMHEHSRSVFKLAINPHSSPLLLSASHDGNVILWDLRDAKPAMRISSRDRYKNSSGGVRDVKWSPTDGTEFAFSTDMGSVQKWDFRHNGKAKLRINAHEKYCTAIDWHPDGKHLMSAGHDKWIKIWDFASGSKRQRPQWFIRTPYPVTIAKWRPEYWHPEEHRNGSWQCTQIVTSYERQFSSVVHLWDFLRPNIPYREMFWWNSAPTDMLWQNQRFLWSVDRDGVFQQGDIHYAPKVIDRRPMQAFALSPTGEICVFSRKRSRQRPAEVRPPIEAQNDETNPSTLVERFESSSSILDVDLDHNLLSTSYKRNQQRPTGNSYAKSATSTPPSYSDNEMHRVAWLNDSLTRKRDVPASQLQTAYRGYIDGTLNTHNFTYLAQKYKTEVIPVNLSVDSFLQVGRIFEQNAAYAQKTGAYRVAQTWRVLSTLITHELQNRAKQDRHQRMILRRQCTAPKPAGLPGNNRMGGASVGHGNIQGQSLSTRGNQNLEIAGFESSSNVQTPLARAQVANARNSETTDNSLPNLENDALQLSPSLGDVSTGIPDRNAGSAITISDGSDALAFRETHWFPSAHDINARRSQAQNWRAGSRQPLEFEYQSPSPQIKEPPRLERHDSNDSFGMFSASSGSQILGTSIGSFTSNKNHPPNLGNMTGAAQTTGSSSAAYFISPAAESGLPSDTKGNLSWLTSSSSMDFGGRGASAGNEVIEHPQDTNQDSYSDHDHTLMIASQEKQSEKLSLKDLTKASHDYCAQPVHAAQMLNKLYRYYTVNTPNAQAVHHIATILKPLLTIAQADTSLGPTAYPRDTFDVKPAQQDAILFTYYDQLQSLQIHNPSVVLARDAQQHRDEPLDGFTTGSQVGLVCIGCNKPMNNALTKFRCENCGQRQSNCPICWQKYPAYMAMSKTRKSVAKLLRTGESNHAMQSSPTDHVATRMNGLMSSAPIEPVFTEAEPHELDNAPQSNHAILWQSCLVCGHGAHAACLQHIQNDPKIGGKCPTDGCLCDCIPGVYRMRLNRENEETRRKSSVSWVRGDTISVIGESGAVKGARTLLDRDHRESGGTVASDRPKQEEKRVRVVEPKSRRG